MNAAAKVLKVENCPTCGILKIRNNKYCEFISDKIIFHGIILPEYTNSEYDIFVVQIITSNINLINEQLLNFHFIFCKYPGKNTYFAFNDFYIKNLLNYRNEIIYSAYKSDKLKALCYVISKCGCSTLVNTFIKYDVDSQTDLNLPPWEKREKFIVKANYTDIETTTKYDDYVKFIIVRDPIERFLSLCNYVITVSNYISSYNSQNYYSNSFDKRLHIDLILCLAKMNSYVKNSKLKDQHFSPQYDEIKSITKYDCVVWLKDLQAFFLEKFDAVAIKCNENTSNLISKTDLTNTHIKKIKDIYKEDYEFLNTATFYKPKNPGN